MDKIKLNSFAKINLTLDVKSIREDGYHNLDMVLSSVNIADTIVVAKADGVFVKMNNVIQNEKNTAYMAVKLAIDQLGIKGAKVDIIKRIPFCAGMGGSSADASGVLFALQKLYQLDESKVLQLAESVGSDVPYMFFGGLKRARGKGEKLENLDFLPFNLLLIKPQMGVNTGEVFKTFDKLPEFTEYTQKLLTAIVDKKDFKPFLGNGLYNSAGLLNPQIKKALNDIKCFTPYAVMTGSGSAIYGIFDDTYALEYAYERLKNTYTAIYKLESREYGIEVLLQV